MEKREAAFRDPTRSWSSRDDDSRMTCYMGMTGRISVASLLAHMATVAPAVRPEEMMLNWSTVKWEEPSTDDDRSKREEWRQRQAERTEKWERETLERLRAKYE